MKATVLGVLAALALLVPAASAQIGGGTEPDDSQLLAYTVLVTGEQADQLRKEHFDISAVHGAVGNALELEVIMTEADARRLEARGIRASVNPGQGVGIGARAVPKADGVFRPYGGTGGLQDEVLALASEFPDITDVEVIGQSTLGTDILAIQVTKNAGLGPDGQKPTALYVSAQHAREWITPEVNRRLLRHVLERYGTDEQVTSIVDTTELWFVLVANPDGYDYTFTPGNRLWRKTLTDNDGDGQITGFDGVDPNRNFPTFWGYDDEGSSSDPSSSTYRGPAPASEPETVAFDALVARLTPEFLVNYHSAAELILYGVGHQVATPTPDDVILAALAGDDANPAIAGFDPDLSAELYTTNGETTEHMAATYGTLSFTPELSECQSVSPDPGSCVSVFNFPDDEALIQAEFERNLPFALDIALSAQNPYEPVSHLGNTAPDFVLDEFDESHGSSQTVQATVSRQVRNPQLRYRVNGSSVASISSTREWNGGERYGGDFDYYYRDVRATINGLQPGDTVEYWFRGGTAAGGNVVSERSTFTVTDDPETVLIIANEDYDGVTPAQGLSAPAYLGFYTDALDANGTSYDVWDMDSQGSPHPLGILSHYDAVIWYVGDNIITQDPEDRDVLFPNSEIGVHEDMQFTTLAVRDFLNEGGALLKTGDRSGYFGQFVATFGGLLYGDNGAPFEVCSIETDLFGDCLLYSDDFHQYWLGDYGFVPFGEPQEIVGIGSPLDGLVVDVNGSDSANNSFDAGQSIVTSSILDPAQFPLFSSSRSIADFGPVGQNPFEPLTGDFYVGVLARNDQYNRFTRTVDLTGAASANLSFSTSYDVEGNYDFFVVEAHTVGADNWTTLEDLNGNTPDVLLAVCFDGLWDVHPFIFDHYVDESTCTSPGPTGAFHPFNGNSNGYVDASFDLSAFLGTEVEISLTYISDVGVTNTGAFVDDLVIDVDGVTEVQGWETDQQPWSVAPPPPGSPATITEWERSEGLVSTVLSAAVATDDTVYLPFGFEAIATAAERNEVMGRILDYLLD